VGDLRARFGIAPAAARRLSGAPLQVKPAGGGASFDAPILSIDPTIDPQTRLASVFVEAPAGQGLGAGQALVAEAPLRQAGNAVTIPYAAVLDEGGQPYVFVVKGKVAHRHDVVTGATGGKLIQIVSGLAPGDEVVTEGGTALEDGMKVRTR
jgi:RND family efflux transporter MFP subunit